MTAVIILYKYRSAMLQAKYSKKAPTGVFFGSSKTLRFQPEGTFEDNVYNKGHPAGWPLLKGIRL